MLLAYRDVENRGRVSRLDGDAAGAPLERIGVNESAQHSASVKSTGVNSLAQDFKVEHLKAGGG